MVDYGCGEKLVAVSDFAVLPENLKVERIGGYYDLNIEKLIDLNPDIIFAEKSHRKKLNNFPSLLKKTVFLSFLTLKDTFESYKIIGEKLGIKREIIEKKIKALKGKQKSLERENRCGGKKILVILGGGREKIYACGDNYFTEVFEKLGFVNVLKNSKVPYPELSYESFYSLNPDFIFILSSERECFNPCKDGKLKMLSACKEGNVYLFYGKKLLHAGSGLDQLLTGLKKVNKCFR